MGVVAIALLLADGLTALQTATIATALPFSVILLIALWGLFKALSRDAAKQSLRHQALNLSSGGSSSGDNWQRRLRNMIMMPRRNHVMRFIDDTVEPAFEAVAAELGKHGYEVQVSRDEKNNISLDVMHGEHLDFHYSVHPKAYAQPVLVPRDQKDQEERKYFRAEVHLREGGQDYDIMGWSLNGVIGDVLDQYERHRHYLHLTR
jgi:choline/glycine/proline betaine transport protein